MVSKTHCYWNCVKIPLSFWSKYTLLNPFKWECGVGQSVIYHLCLLLFLWITILWIPKLPEITNLFQVTPSSPGNQIMKHPSSHELIKFGLTWFLVQQGWLIGFFLEVLLQDSPRLMVDSFLWCLVMPSSELQKQDIFGLVVWAEWGWPHRLKCWMAWPPSW